MKNRSLSIALSILFSGAVFAMDDDQELIKLNTRRGEEVEVKYKDVERAYKQVINKKIMKGGDVEIHPEGSVTISSPTFSGRPIVAGAYLYSMSSNAVMVLGVRRFVPEFENACALFGFKTTVFAEYSEPRNNESLASLDTEGRLKLIATPEVHIFHRNKLQDKSVESVLGVIKLKSVTCRDLK
jgi:hypothetical protein